MDLKNLQCKRKHSLFPVTALQFIENYVLAGEGPDLTVYDWDKNERISVVKVFIDATIHGIRIYKEKTEQRNDYSVCVFGSKSFRLLDFYLAASRLEITSHIVTLEDWIWDVAWLQLPVVTVKGMTQSPDTMVGVTINEEGISQSSSTKNSSEIRDPSWTDYEDNGDSRSLGLACVLGHNSVYHLNIRNFHCIDHIHCEEKCILYSATSVGQTWDALVVASGTVFNHVVLWKPSGPRNLDGAALVTHRLDTHEGVIFSTHYNCRKSMLASVSDDRSIRLWKIQPKCEASVQTEPVSTTSTTNDGVNLLLSRDLSSLQFSEDRVLYGHKARVWDVRLLEDYVISIGEDSTCCVWTYEGEVIQRYKGHQGKSIWSLAVTEDETIMATGGGDTSIRLWPVCKDSITQSTPDLTEYLQPPHTQDKDADLPRIVGLNCNSVLTMTNDGVLCKYDTSLSCWDVVFKDESFKSYSVLSTSRCHDVFAVGNICGMMKIFIQGRCLQIQAGSGKIHSIVWLYPDGQLSSTQPGQLLTTGPEGALTMWQLDVCCESVHLVQKFILPYTKQRWITTALLLPQKGVLIGGDRGGTLHIFAMEKQEPVQSLWKIHGKTGVTDICCHGDQVYSAGRDGQYRVFELCDGELQLLSVHKVYKGFEWIARLRVTEEGMMALGFHTDQFVAYSITTNQKLLSIPCGGGHRAWDFTLDMQSGVYHFVYIKNKDVAHCQGHLNVTQRILKASLHGRAVCVVRHLFSDEECDIVATAGEDTMINLLSLNGSSENVIPQVIGRLQGHLSSVRALAVCKPYKVPGSQELEYCNDTTTATVQKGPDNLRKVVMFSAGGRAELKAWAVYNNNYGIRPGAWGKEEYQSNGSKCELKNTEERCVINDKIPVESEITAHSSKGQQSSSNVHTSSRKVESRTNGRRSWYKYLGTHSLTQSLRSAFNKSLKSGDCEPDPETRYMDLSAFCVSDVNKNYPNHLYIVMAACSDGFVRLLAFNEVTSKFTLLAASEYHNHCVLKVKHLILNNNNTTGATTGSACSVLLITAATDGRIALWDVYDVVDAFVTYQCVTADGLYPSGGVIQAGSLSDHLHFGSAIDLPTPRVSVPIHQSGINSLDVLLLSDNCFLLASGGDDNMLAVSTFEICSEDNTFHIQYKAKALVESMHSAQITGIQWLEQDLLLSVSIDQRLCVWKVSADKPELVLTLCKFINVSDVSSCDVWKSRLTGYNVVIGGVGVQYVQIQ